MRRTVVALLAVAMLALPLGSSASSGQLTDYQRRALGFGTKANWPLTEAFRRDNIAAEYSVDADPAFTTPGRSSPRWT